jgi:hypothetical protein
MQDCISDELNREDRRLNTAYQANRYNQDKDGFASVQGTRERRSGPLTYPLQPISCDVPLTREGSDAFPSMETPRVHHTAPGGLLILRRGRNDPCKWEFSYLDPRKQPMAGYSFYPLNHSFYPLNLREWLLGIGRQLQAEYDDAVGAAPVPERIAALLKQLETDTFLQGLGH